MNKITSFLVWLLCVVIFYGALSLGQWNLDFRTWIDIPKIFFSLMVGGSLILMISIRYEEYADKKQKRNLYHNN